MNQLKTPQLSPDKNSLSPDKSPVKTAEKSRRESFRLRSKTVNISEKSMVKVNLN